MVKIVNGLSVVLKEEGKMVGWLNCLIFRGLDIWKSCWLDEWVDA